MIGCTRRKDSLDRASAEADFDLTAGEITTLVEDAVIYGFPLVANYGVLYEHSINQKSRDFKAPLNQIHHEARVYTYKDRSIVTPNSDTPYSSVMMDLRTEPVVLSVPAVEDGRYFSVQLCDGNAFNYGYIGTRVTGHEAGDYLVVGPGWQGDAPAGVKKVFRSSTHFSIAIFRTQLFSPKDIDNVKNIQAGCRSRTLSEYRNQPALDTRNARYTLTFPAGGLPPVDAFWSLTVYNGLTFLLIKNPIVRYLINSAMVPGMKTNPDGSLTIYIQKDSPGPDKESNWLPGRKGIIMLVMRLYLPKPEAFNGTWKPPAIEMDQP
jgi:hypothetical protein